MSRLRKYTKEFFIFGLKHARAAVFAGSFLGLLLISNHIPLFGLARYDFLFLAAVLVQVVLYYAKLENKLDGSFTFVNM